MKKLVNYCSIIFLLLVATSQVKAQSVDVVIRENGTERKESIDLPKSMTYPLDSLLNDWKAKNYIDLGKDCSTAEINPLFFHSLRHIYYLSAVILPTFGNSNGKIENTYVYEESSNTFNLFNWLSDRLPCTNGGRTLLFQKS